MTALIPWIIAGLALGTAAWACHGWITEARLHASTIRHGREILDDLHECVQLAAEVYEALENATGGVVRPGLYVVRIGEDGPPGTVLPPTRTAPTDRHRPETETTG